eukprot:2065647-Amphidinium_carterae.1
MDRHLHSMGFEHGQSWSRVGAHCTGDSRRAEVKETPNPQARLRVSESVSAATPQARSQHGGREIRSVKHIQT